MPQKQWTFLSNHGHVLVHVTRHPEARISEIADSVGITERSAQLILADLQEAGYIRIIKNGRRNTYKTNTSRKFRHPSEATESIGSLVSIFV
jgi:DNA-binding MarR family transcriptional regulator